MTAQPTNLSTHDLVIAHARIIDGCGNPWYRGDVGVDGATITAIAAPGTLQGVRVVDAGDRYLAPGFVDPHTHSDVSILVYPEAASVVSQGVTTHVIGNCGITPAPIEAGYEADMARMWLHDCPKNPDGGLDWHTFGEYLSAVERRGTGLNIVPLVGHSALRLAVMGFEERAATSDDLARMCELLDASLSDGAFGLSSGLVYPPGCYADTEELVALCEVVARYGGIYTSHIRGERETILQAVAEAIAIGERSGVPVQISHNAPKWGAPRDASANMGLIAEARARGLDVTADNDAHTDLCVTMMEALPQWLLGLPVADAVAIMRDPGRRADLRREVEEDRLPGAGYVGLLKHRAYERIVVFSAPQQPELVGHTVADVAAARRCDPFDAFLDIVVAEDGEAVAIFDYILLDNIRRVLTDPNTMFCSDGSVAPPCEDLVSQGIPEYSPCSYGEYPGFLERFVRDRHDLTLEDAVRRMTSFPAQRFGLSDRGVVRPGMAADLVIFDVDRLRDRATNLYPHTAPFENIPHEYSEGIDHVIIGGVAVVEDGRRTGALAGRVLRAPRGRGARRRSDPGA